MSRTELRARIFGLRLPRMFVILPVRYLWRVEFLGTFSGAAAGG